MVDLSKHKLTGHKELHELLQVPGFYDFAIKVYDYFETMIPGRSVSFEKYQGEKLEWVVKVACLFVTTNNHFYEYELSDDCTRLRRFILKPHEKAFFRKLLGIDYEPKAPDTG